MKNIFEPIHTYQPYYCYYKKIRKKNPLFHSSLSWTSIIKNRNVFLTCNKIWLYRGRHFQFQNQMNRVKPLGKNRLIFELANEIPKKIPNIRKLF